MRTAAIRRLVSDPFVEDTHNIDRGRFTLTSDVSPGPLEGPFWLLWATAMGVAAGVVAAGIGQNRLGDVGSRLWRAGPVAANLVTPALDAVKSVLTRGVPELRSEVLGFFRFFYAAFLFAALASGRLRLAPGRYQTTASWAGGGSVGWPADRI